jgi:hypothetical protein
MTVCLDVDIALRSSWHTITYQVCFPGYLNGCKRGEHSDLQDLRVSSKSRLEAVFVIEEHAKAKYFFMKRRGCFRVAYGNEGDSFPHSCLSLPLFMTVSQNDTDSSIRFLVLAE